MKYSKNSSLVITLLFAVLVLISMGSCKNTPLAEDSIITSELPILQFDYEFTISDTEDLILQRIRNISTDSKGRIYLTDSRALQIHQFSPVGNYMTSIGREGEGPGEFMSILNTYIDEKDRLFINDVQLARNTIFIEEDGEWVAQQFFSIDGQRYGIESADSSGNTILRQSPPQYPERGAYWYEHELARGHLSSGLLEPKVRTFKDMGFLFNGTNLAQIPFGRTTVVTTDRSGNIYLVWNESFDLAKYNVQVEWIDSLSVTIPNQPVGAKEKEEEIDKINDNLRSLAQQHTPDTKPVIEDMHVDEMGRIWLQTHDSPEYLILDNQGNPLRSFDLEMNNRLRHVDHQRLYTIEVNDSGYHVHVYKYRL